MKGFIDRFRETIRTSPGTADAVGGQNEAPAQAEYSCRLLFVCMGNICRSPTAEGVFRKVLAERAPDLRVQVDSAGTHAYHVGAPPDPRAVRAAERRGIDLRSQRARVVVPEDFERFDLLIAMDELNLLTLRESAPTDRHERIRLLLEFAPRSERRDVPDPYYGAANGFEYVLDLVEEASLGLLDHVRNIADSARKAR